MKKNEKDKNSITIWFSKTKTEGLDETERILASAKEEKYNKLWNNKTWWCIFLATAGIIASCIEILPMPEGGMVTMLSLFIVWLFTFIYGFQAGALFGVAFGILRFIIVMLGFGNEQIFVGVPSDLKPLVFLMEYPIAYGIISLGDLVHYRTKKEYDKIKDRENVTEIFEDKTKLIGGYILGVFCMYVVYVLTAITCYDPGERIGKFSLENIRYCMQYDSFPLIAEIIITLCALAIPVFREAVFYVKFIATHDMEEEDYF